MLTLIVRHFYGVRYTDDMRVYFSGIGGVGIGPLAEIAKDAGYDVVGSDMQESSITRQLQQAGIEVMIGQDGSQLDRAHKLRPIEWLVYTSALPADHAELVYARDHGIKTSKRDEFLADFIKEHDLSLIAIAGTHGKTTTTGLFMYTLHHLGIPLSYSVGTTVSWASSGAFNNASKLFAYECDEYDHNFLHFEPRLSIITALDHDHVDTYPTVKDYRNAFIKFVEQSNYSLMWEKDLQYLEADLSASYEAYDEHMRLDHIKLAGNHVRHNAYLVERAIMRLMPELDNQKVIEAINAFPGTARRFEKLADSLYSDYGHHPSEIAATLQLAREINDEVVLVYQPHQNLRQHEIRSQYADCMKLASKIYWLPTYLTREDPKLSVLSPNDLIESLINKESAQSAEMNPQLWQDINKDRREGKLVLFMGAGTIDSWVRQQLAET